MGTEAKRIATHVQMDIFQNMAQMNARNVLQANTGLEVFVLILVLLASQALKDQQTILNVLSVSQDMSHMAGLHVRNALKGESHHTIDHPVSAAALALINSMRPLA